MVYRRELQGREADELIKDRKTAGRGRAKRRDGVNGSVSTRNAYVRPETSMIQILRNAWSSALELKLRMTVRQSVPSEEDWDARVIRALGFDETTSTHALKTCEFSF